MLNDKELPSNYEYDHKIKELKYRAIIKALQGVNKEIKHACTFTGNSNYQFERMLVKSFPGIQIHCFDNDVNEALKNLSNSPTLPEGVSYTLLRKDSSAEEYILNNNEQYDLVWFDYKGGPLQNLTGLLLKNLEAGGLFAMTTYTGHLCNERNADISLIPRMKPAIDLFKYRTSMGPMQFSAFWKTNINLKFPQLITICPVNEKDTAREAGLTPFQQRTQERNKNIVAAFQKGISRKDLVAKFNTPIETVGRVIRLALKVKAAAPSCSSSWGQVKNHPDKEKIIAEYQKGSLSVNDVAKKFSISRSSLFLLTKGEMRRRLFCKKRPSAFDLTDAYQYYDLLSKSDQIIIDLVKAAKKLPEIAEIMQLTTAAIYNRIHTAIPKKLTAAKAGKKVWNLNRPNEYIPNIKEALAFKHAA